LSLTCKIRPEGEPKIPLDSSLSNRILCEIVSNATLKSGRISPESAADNKSLEILTNAVSTL